MRAASKDKWLEAHGIEHWTHFYTDYGRELQRKFFDHFLQRRGHRLGRAAARAAAGAPSGDKFVERAENEWPIARTGWTKLYLNSADFALRETSLTGEATSHLRRARRRRHLHLAAAGRRDRDHRAVGARSCSFRRRRRDADLFLVLRVFSADLREVVFQGAIDPHTPIAQGWLRASHRKLDPKLIQALPALSHPRREAAAEARRVGRARHRDLADLHRRAGRLPRRAHGARQGLRIWRRPAAGGSRISRTS